MNAPFSSKQFDVATGTLQLFAFFHLNIAFSSIEEEQRDEVIARCYWPLLHLAERHGPVGLEASGFTLEEIAASDPLWIDTLKRLVVTGRVEFIGAGYSQMIGPLVPARVTEANLAIGNEIYQRLLGVKPSIALVNEQAYSGGLVGLYLVMFLGWTGVGAFLLTDNLSNLPSLFEPGVHVGAYDSVEDCLVKIRRYLDDERTRETIARAGQAHTLTHHTYRLRIEELLRLIEKYAH